MNSRILIPAIVIGAVLGLAIGYVNYKANGGMGDFFVWIEPSNMFGRARDAITWMIGGIIVAGAATFLRRPNSN